VTPADKDGELVKETDKLFHATVVQGVLLDAKSALDNKRYRAAAVLTYCGIDTLASLVRDAASPKVQRADFVAWAERYMDFRSKHGPTGLELYGARCGLLHASMAESETSKKDEKIRLIGYADKNSEPVMHDENVKTLIILSTTHLVGIFAEGVLKCWKDIKADKGLLHLVNQRLQKLYAQFNVSDLKSRLDVKPELQV
jgi:hypothetical protein